MLVVLIIAIIWKTFFVDEGNIKYKSIDGMLFESTILLQCPIKNRKPYIPEGTTKIGIDVFANIENFTKIEIPDRVEEFCFRALSNCKGLIEITIPEV